MNEEYAERLDPNIAISNSEITEKNLHISRYEFAISKSNINRSCKVLDAACGAGYGSRLISGKAGKVFGIDISPVAISYAMEKYSNDNITFELKSLYDISQYGSRVFDRIVSLETIEHLEYVEKYISLVKDVLKEDGTFVCSIPFVTRTNSKPENPHHKIEYATPEFISILRRYFDKIDVFYQVLNMGYKEKLMHTYVIPARLSLRKIKIAKKLYNALFKRKVNQAQDIPHEMGRILNADIIPPSGVRLDQLRHNSLFICRRPRINN